MMSAIDITLRVLTGKADQKQYKLTKHTVLVGSGERCDVRLYHSDVPDVQLILQKAEDTYIVRRAGHLPLLVDGVQRDQAVLRGEEELRFAKYVLKCESGETGKKATARPAEEVKGHTPRGTGLTAGRKSKLYLIVGFYYLLLMGGISFFMLGDTSDSWLLPERIEALNSAYEESELPARDTIRSRAYEVIFHAKTVPVEQTRMRLHELIIMTISADPKPGKSGQRSEDPLRLFLMKQYKSFGALENEK